MRYFKHKDHVSARRLAKDSLAIRGMVVNGWAETDFATWANSQALDVRQSDFKHLSDFTDAETQMWADLKENKQANLEALFVAEKAEEPAEAKEEVETPSDSDSEEAQSEEVKTDEPSESTDDSDVAEGKDVDVNEEAETKEEDKGEEQA